MLFCTNLFTKCHIIYDSSSSDVFKLSLKLSIYLPEQNIFHFSIFFHFNNISLLSDNEGVFLQIYLNKNYRDALIFNFMQEDFTICKDVLLQLYKFKHFLFKDNICSLYLLATTKHLVKTFHEVCAVNETCLITLVKFKTMLHAYKLCESSQISREDDRILKVDDICLRKWMSKGEPLL